MIIRTSDACPNVHAEAGEGRGGAALRDKYSAADDWTR